MQGIDHNHRMQNAKCLSLLSMARRAGKLLFGEDACLQSIRNHSARLIMMDGQISENTEKRFVNACMHHNVPLWRFDRDSLDVAQAVGRGQNKAISLIDPGFYRRLREYEEMSLPAMSRGRPNREQEAAKIETQGVER